MESNPLGIYFKMGSPTVLLDENFSGTFPPEGWSTVYWVQNISSGCSEPPCAFWYKYLQGPVYDFPITSKAVDASEYEKFVLEFCFGADANYPQYCSIYVKYRKNATSSWIDITPWDNPIQGNMDPDYYEIEVTWGSEGCGDALQINWSYVGYFYFMNYLWLDDVKILGIDTSNNSAPYTPSNYTPCGGVSENVINLSWDGGDPDPEDSVYYDVYFGTYFPLPIIASIGPYPANQTRIEYGPVELQDYTTYYWMIGAWNKYGDYVEGPICSITSCDNHPPSKPIIDGPTHGKVGVEYTYTFNSTDPENHSIKYLVNWGDGTEETTDLLPNSTIVTLSHSWDTKGTYIIKAKAIDEHDAESEWGELEVTMPRDKAINRLIQNFLQSHPHLLPLLQKLIQQHWFGL
jgi:hypothetical protein